MKQLSRFAFLGAFLATITAWAQTIITPCRPELQWSGQIPLCNGQCPNPECAYRAPEFPSLPPRLANGRQDWDSYNKAYGLPYGRLISEFFTDSADQYISYRLNRCPNCNTAFWQDPEPSK